MLVINGTKIPISSYSLQPHYTKTYMSISNSKNQEIFNHLLPNLSLLLTI